VSGETDVPLEWGATKNVAWKTAIPGEGWSSPIVSGDRVFVTAATDGGASYRLICLDRRGGAVLWDKEVLRQPKLNKGGQNSFASSTPATDGKQVYVVAVDGSIAAVGMDGTVAWAYRDFKYYSQHGLSVSPVLYKDLVIVPFDYSSTGPDKSVGWQKPWDKSVILAVEAATGKLRWQAKRGMSRIAHVTPRILSVDGKDQLVSAAGDVIQGFDLASGERLWTVASRGEGVVPSVVLGDGLIYTCSGFSDPTIRAVRTGGTGECTATHLAWEQKRGVSMIPSMLYAKPYLYAVNEKGNVRCLKADTGEIAWEDKLKGSFSASPVWAAGRIYITSESGETTVIASGDAWKVLATNTLGEKVCASPAITRGHILIRTDKNLYSIGAAEKAEK
jgi:outer membrane protein assembly factor BamB